MTPDTVILAAVLAFFGLFGATLFIVSVWCSLTPDQPSRAKSIRARRPASLADTIRNSQA